MKKVLLYLLTGVMMLTTSCKNEEKTNSDESTSEKAIAVYDSKTGVMTYNFDAETLTIKINDQFATRGEQPSDKFIIESSELVNKNANNIFTILEVVYIDTEEEISTTAWLTDNFIKTEISENKTYYYIDDEVQSNNYSFCYNIGRNVYIVDVVNGFSSSREWDGLSKLPARWFVQCKGHNCNASTCQPEQFEGYYGCTPCSVIDKDHWCEQTTTTGAGLGSIIGSIISAIGSLIK